MKQAIRHRLLKLRDSYPVTRSIPFVASIGWDHSYEQWARVVMNTETERLVRSLDPGTLRVLEVSGHSWNRPGLFKEYRSSGYPEFDLCEGPLDDRFDLIIAEQVFEHLLWPYRAARHVFQMLAPGGAFLITTPFLVRIHENPVDCSRWTEVGLKHFLAECGFSLNDIQTGSWGNRAAVIANFTRWEIYKPWRHSLANDPELPLVVWALAKRTGASQ